MQPADINAQNEGKAGASKVSNTPSLSLKTRYQPVIEVTKVHSYLEDEAYECRKSGLEKICYRHLRKMVPRSKLIASKGGALLALVPAAYQPVTEPFLGMPPGFIKMVLIVSVFLAAWSLLKDVISLLRSPGNFSGSTEQVVGDIMDELEGKERPDGYWNRLKRVFQSF